MADIVNRLVRAAASIPTNISDTDLDRHVADLLAKEAKDKEVRWREMGIGALVGRDGGDGSRDASPNLPRPNKRFLTTIIQQVDDHNSALLKEQAEAAREARRAVEGSRRGVQRRDGGRDRDAWDSNGIRRIPEDTDRNREGYRGHDRVRDREREREPGRTSRHEEPSSSVSTTKIQDRRGAMRMFSDALGGMSGSKSSGTGPSRRDVIEARDEGRHSARDERERGESSSSTWREVAGKRRPPPDDKMYEPSTEEGRARHHRDDQEVERLRSNRRKTSRVEDEVKHERLERKQRAQDEDEERHEARSHRHREEKRDVSSSKRRSSLELGDRLRAPNRREESQDLYHKRDSPYLPTSDQPLPPPPASKMDKYFTHTYDPRLDFSAVLPVPASGLVDAASSVEVGWDTMLDVLKSRGKKARRQSPGLEDDEPLITSARSGLTNIRRRENSPAKKTKHKSSKYNEELESEEELRSSKKKRRSQRSPSPTSDSTDARERRRRKKRKEKERREEKKEDERVEKAGGYRYVKKGGEREWDKDKEKPF